MNLDKEKIVQLTEEYGGQWGLKHTGRLISLCDEIGQGLSYNAEALWLAAHLHDWGAYSAWAIQGMDHCQRSAQVAETFLNEWGIPADIQALVQECILLHHAPGSDRSLESILLRDADALDFLGVVGILRNFSMYTRDLRLGYQETRRRQARCVGVLSLESSKILAAERIKNMDEVLKQFDTETSGLY